MSVTLYHSGTEYTSNAITLLRGLTSDILNVGVFHDQDPTYIPLVSDFILVTLADGTSHPPNPLAVAGELDVVALIGPKTGAQVFLQTGVYQRWVLVQTVTQDLIRAVDTVTVL